MSLVPNGENLVPFIESREHQIEAWNNLAFHRESGEKQALVHMATGLGKTIVVAGDIASFSSQFRTDHHREPKILLLAHQVELLRQAKDYFARIIPEKSTSNMFAGDKSFLEEEPSDILFATLQSMSTYKKRFSKDYFDYVVVDESHHAMAPHFEETIAYFEPQFRLGVTATPFRKDEKDLSSLFGEIVYSKTLAEAVSDKLLDAPNYEVVADDLLQDSIRSDFKKNKELREAIFDVERNKSIARHIVEKQLTMERPRTIIFAQNIAHAEDFTPYVEGAVALHSELSIEDRKNIISAFRRGDISTIVAIDMLNEGIDVPEANLAVFLRSTASRTIFEQQLGRILRKLAGKSTHVLDFVGTAERLEMIYDLSEEVRLINESKAEELGIDLYAEGMEYTLFGTFNPKFDSWSVDVIEKLRRLTESQTPAPEGWMNVGQLADLLQRDTFWIYKFIRQEGFDTIKYQTPTKHNATYVSPEDVASLVYTHENPDGWASIADLEIILGLSNSYISDYISKNGLETKFFVARDESTQVRTTRHISPQDAMVMIDNFVINEPPKDWVSIGLIAKELDTERLPIRRAIKRLGIEAVKYASVDNQQISWHVSPVDEFKIKEFFNPVGWTSILQLSEEFGVSTQEIKMYARKVEIVMSPKIVRRSKDFPTDHVTDDDAMSLRSYFRYREANVAPTDFVAVKDLADEYGLSTSAISAMAKKMGGRTETYHPADKARHQVYLTPEIAEKLRIYYDFKKTH